VPPALQIRAMRVAGRRGAVCGNCDEAATRRLVAMRGHRIVVRRSSVHRTTPAPGGPMDAIAMLENEHRQMRKLLGELEATTDRAIKTRQDLFATIKGELTLHEVIEEEIFYPELKAHPRAEDFVLEGYQEHHVVDLLMGELEDLDVGDETWGPKAKVMQENVEHHMEEEEGDMFKQARRVFDKAELEDLGRRMEERRQTAAKELNIPVAANR
jgi:hypothetical protein